MAKSEPGAGPLAELLVAAIGDERLHWREAAAKIVDYRGSIARDLLACRMREHYAEDIGEPDNPLRKRLLQALSDFPFPAWAAAFLDEAIDDQAIDEICP